MGRFRHFIGAYRVSSAPDTSSLSLACPPDSHILYTNPARFETAFERVYGIRLDEGEAVVGGATYDIQRG